MSRQYHITTRLLILALLLFAASCRRSTEKTKVLQNSLADVPAERLAYVASISWIAGLPEAKRADTFSRMRAIVQGGETPEHFALHVDVGLTERLR